jgi:hypothetical protein
MGHHHHQRQPKEAASDDEPEMNARVNAVRKRRRRQVDEATAWRANATFARFAGRKISEKEKALRKESLTTASHEFTAATAAAARQREEVNAAAIKAAAEAAAAAPRLGLPPPADLRQIAATPPASMIPSRNTGSIVLRNLPELLP